jgi:hypothetical protein
MQRILAALRALHHGASVADPATWKKRQVAVNAVVGLVSALSVFAASMGWMPQEFSDQTIMQFGEGLAMAVFAVLGAFNVGVTAATTNKIGLGRKPGMPEPADAELYDVPSDGEPERQLSAAEQGRRAFRVD